jgi:hypothetical protein
MGETQPTQRLVKFLLDLAGIVAPQPYQRKRLSPRAIRIAISDAISPRVSFGNA